MPPLNLTKFAENIIIEKIFFFIVTFFCYLTAWKTYVV